MKNLFVYGALMYDEVWNSIVSGKHDKTSARLSGYKRLKVKDEEYPAIVKGDGTVKGYIWFNVDDENIARLDNFEAECYERVEESAQDMNGRDIKVDVYRIRDNYKTILEDVEWDEEYFEKIGLNNFIQNYEWFKRS